MVAGVYDGPEYAAAALASLVPDTSARIIDVAAGSGKVAQQLRIRGYDNIDGMDPCREMLGQAKQRNLYINYIYEPINGSPSSITADSYDGLVISGGMGEGHIPADAVNEMVRVVKPGGVIVIVMREEYLEYVTGYKDGALENLMDQLEKDNKWIKLSRTVVPNYSFNKNGLVFAYKVC